MDDRGIKMPDKIDDTFFSKFEYYREHQVCPKCQSKDVEVDITEVLKGIDNNPAKCLKCKWSGIIHELTKKD